MFRYIFMAEELSIKAANMYAEGSSFGDISRDLEVSKSQVGGLLREGILSIKNQEAPSVRPTEEQQNIIETMDHQNPMLPIRQPEVFYIETEGIGKRIVLTPKAIMIFDLFKKWGFSGDLSSFIEDSIDFLYQMRRPMERGTNL